jgi:hypothetical protein
MTFRRWTCSLVATLVVAGCQSTTTTKPMPPGAPDPAPRAEKLVPYVPATRPVDPVTEALPSAPQDARRAVPIGFTIELWEILMPRDSVSRDESFWKRVDEPAGFDGEILLKNGVRAGQMPTGEIETFRKLIADRGGKHSSYVGTVGKLIEIPVRSDVPEQTVFFRNRDDQLVGRSWERCDNFLYFSFETTPRNPDSVRIALTPGVRSRERKMVYAAVPGRQDRELKTVVEESNYDVSVQADLPLDRMMVISPSAEAQSRTSIGGTFFTNESATENRERLILVIPHAYTRDETAAGPAK